MPPRPRHQSGDSGAVPGQRGGRPCTRRDAAGSAHVPDERALRAAAGASGSVYLRLSELANAAPLATGLESLTVLRTGFAGTVIVVGPLADAVLQATSGMDVTVLYAATIRPFDGRTLRATLGVPDIVLVEPYLAGTSVPAVAAALADIPHRLLGLGVGREELRRYDSATQHQAAHRLEPAALRADISGFLGTRLDSAARPRARRHLV